MEAVGAVGGFAGGAAVLAAARRSAFEVSLGAFPVAVAAFFAGGIVPGALMKLAAIGEVIPSTTGGDEKAKLF